MRKEELLSFWGEDRLKRWGENILTGAGLPAGTQAFLSEIGLPVGVDWTFRFNPEQLPTLPGRNQYRIIGYDDVVPICIDVGAGGRVIAAETSVGGADRYINSDVERFAECLVYFQQYRIAARKVSESEIQEVINTTQKKMQASDLTAFANPNYWWPVIVEQMNDGLL